jgi:phosphatidate cytidylyltransferase
MTPDLLLRLTVVFVGLFVVGSALCLPIYHWRIRSFLASSLWIKIIWWVPIYGVFISLCYGRAWVATPLALLLIIQALREYLRHPSTSPVVHAYLIFFVIATTSIMTIPTLVPAIASVHLLVMICFCSVLSDVCAFFFGTYLGRHSLPNWINKRKSWEGVFGQIIGSFVGAGFLLAFTPIPISWELVFVIGLASACGDLFNSTAKRTLSIKDWGQTIPGHGGILDRMSSLSTAFFGASILLLLS